jgi:hypothetical protein
MRMTVRFQNAARAEVLLLATIHNRVRVIVAGRGTTEEWLMFGDYCFDESGRPVEIEALLAVGKAGELQGIADVYPRTAAAGSGGTGVAS